MSLSTLLVHPYHVPPLSSHLHFLPHHFTRHKHTHFSFVFLFPLFLPPLIIQSAVTRTHNHLKLTRFPTLPPLPTHSKSHLTTSLSICSILPGHNYLSRALLLISFLFFLFITSHGTNLGCSPHN